MSAASLTLALLLLPAFVGAGDAPVLADMAPTRSSPGWTKQGASLLLYDLDGSLSQELPLRSGEDGGLPREMRGGTSADGRLAWTLESRQTWNPLKGKTPQTHRLLRLYGSAGQELWKDEGVDLPERGQPLIFSADGQTLLLARRAGDDWSVEARTWMGVLRAGVGPFPRLISMALTPNGRFALARWGVIDKSDTHTFFDITAKKRRDVPSSSLLLGLARIGDDGVARSGSKVVLSFETEVSSAPTAAK
ncbi:MAG: hypothetical protein AAB262_12750 [Elusimicrobiota bacterium]